MAVNLLGLLAVALSVTAFARTYSTLRTRSIRFRFSLLVLFSLLSTPAISFATYYLHILPEKEWFYTLRSLPGSELLTIFLGCAGGCLATFLPRFLLAFPLFGVLCVGVIPYLKPILAPLPDDVFAERWEGDACLQSTSASCGPASVASILKSYGESRSEREIARAAHTYAGGTEAWYLARYLRRQGLTPTFAFQRTFAPSVGLPAMVGVRIGAMGHFIAVLSLENDMVTFVDPLSGQKRLPFADFLKLYQFTGFHMPVTKTS